MKLKLVSAALAAASLAACGGSGGGASGSANSTQSGGVVQTVVLVSNPSAPASLTAETPAQFSGGVCSGGSGSLSASWDFGDGTSPSSTGTHTYGAAGQYSVKVTCTDANNDPAMTSNAVSVTVAAAPAAKSGFLGRTWSTFSKIDANNTSIYPVAGLSGKGAVYGVWLQNVTTVPPSNDTSVAMSGSMDTANAASWTPTGVLSTGTAKTTFNNDLYHMRTAPIDVAVSPNGHVVAAWIADSNIWYSTRTESTTWSAPVQLAITPTDIALKVVINDAGNGAIAYCASTGAQAITYTASAGADLTPKQISTKCSSSVGYQTISEQFTRSFDLVIDNATSTVSAVGLMASASTAGNSVVTQATYSLASGWGAPKKVSDDLPDAAFSDFSVSYSLSPSGTYEAIAWSNSGSGGLTNAFARIYQSGSAGAITALQSNNNSRFLVPLIAINDAGHAFAVMANYNSSGGGYAPYMVNYIPSTGWMAVPKLINGVLGYGGVDVAIDQYGNGLVTLSNAGINSLAVTLSADGLTANSAYIITGYGYNDFHYQTMRALPDGRAILVVSARSDNGFTPSGFVVLK